MSETRLSPYLSNCRLGFEYSEGCVPTRSIGDCLRAFLEVVRVLVTGYGIRSMGLNRVYYGDEDRYANDRMGEGLDSFVYYAGRFCGGLEVIDVSGVVVFEGRIMYEASVTFLMKVLVLYVFVRYGRERNNYEALY